MPRRLPPTSVLLALGLALGLLLWLALGDVSRFRDRPPEDEGRSEASMPPRVEVREQRAAPYRPERVLQGQLEADRELELRARQAGRVAERPVAAGDRVEAGETLLALDPDELPERLAQAEAELDVARAELAGAERLRERDLLSTPDYLRRQASVSAAAAEVAALRHSLDETRPAAPFAGVLDRLDVTTGEFLQVGEAWGRLVDDTRLVASAWAPQRDALSLEAGLPATLRLLDGSALSGEVTLVARRADEATRSFRVEVTADNPEGRRLAGASATLVIPLPERRVHRLSPALLELDPDGRLAVKHLDDDDRVRLTRVELVDADTEAARVAGLPERLRLITLGGGFVDAGDRVTPVPAEDASDPAEAP